MGCDGGSIPKRKEIVKEKKKKEKVNPECVAIEKWGYCAVSDYPLRKPIVSTHTGDLLNKEGAIEWLLKYKDGALEAYHKVEDVRGLGSFHSLKDVKELNLKEIDKSKDQPAQSSSSGEIKWADFCCPITGLEMNGKHKFLFSWACGCVVSQRAFNEIEAEKKCLVCQKPYREEDIVVLNATQKDVHKNEVHMAVRLVARELSKSFGLIRPRDGPSTSTTDAESPQPSTSRSSSSRNSSGGKKSRSDLASPAKRQKPQDDDDEF